MFERGTLFRHALDVLRTAGEPLTTTRTTDLPVKVCRCDSLYVRGRNWLPSNEWTIDRGRAAARRTPEGPFSGLFVQKLFCR
jgi:hypothetical protein